MADVEAMLNRGLEMVKHFILNFCKEIDPKADCALLEQASVSLPALWDHFIAGVTEGAELTAHTRYLTWYQHSFRGVKRSLSSDDFSIELNSDGPDSTTGAHNTHFRRCSTRARVEQETHTSQPAESSSSTVTAPDQSRGSRRGRKGKGKLLN